MWKCVSRSIKTLRKTVSKKKTVLSTNAVQNDELHCILKFSPCVLSRCNSISNICRGSYEYFTKEKKDREGPKEKKIKFLYGLKDYFVDALKLSGVLLFVGYYEVYSKRKSIFRISDPYNDERFPRICGYYRGLEYLIDTLGITPYKSVFPEIQAGRSCKGKEKFPADSEAEKSPDENFSGLEEAHQKALGEINNLLGLQCIQSGQKKEALQYFLQSAEEEYAPGIFNLGLCHERGYGTSQNYSRAAELYQKASDLGHATAMYNLGVFYAQGIGGVSLDFDHARKLFTAAALLGQAEAVRALNLEKETVEELSTDVIKAESEEKERNIFTLGQVVFNKFFDHSSCQSERDFSGCDKGIKTDCNKKEPHSSMESDSGVVDLSPQFVLA